MVDFIFMLTRQDQTIPNAARHLDTAIECGIKHIGFKDVGLPFSDLKKLAIRIRESGATAYLEVVSLDAKSEATSAQAAVEIGVDRLMGGTRPHVVAPIIANAGIGYYPFPGTITGHPSVLEGTQEEIVESAMKLAAMEGVTGLDLLAYRWTEETVEELIAAVCSAVPVPVVVAGSIGTPERIGAVARAGAAGFTIGTAAIDGRFPAASTLLNSQLQAIMKATEEGQ
ncbi:HisA/HisF-related TIM barrel protein [Candidatus Bipolaricaulota bacterium]